MPFASDHGFSPSDTIDGFDVDAFVSAYVTAALWSSTDESDDAGGRPMDETYSADDIAPEALSTMRTDCLSFLAEARRHLLVAADHGDYADPLWSLEERAGHDFWLTRNHHGVGFWDRGLGFNGKALTGIAHNYGECDLYVGDDGRLYV